MTHSIDPAHTPIRLFASSTIISLAALVLVYIYMGWEATIVTLLLIAIEMTFSFDNAIINAKVLGTMNAFWQQIFMTIGILVAVFGMRIVFPIVMVMASAGLSWGRVVDLALYDQDEYARVLTGAHTSIASFGGMFLLMLGLHFLFDASRTVHWIAAIERPLQQIGRWWLPTVVSGLALAIVVLLPANHHAHDTLVAGCIGIATYLAIHTLSSIFTRHHEAAEARAGKALQKAGMAGFAAFIYLEVLDASFSLDGVIGAFAITKNVVLIAIGLGIGALWVRSLTLFMVKRHTLHAYRFLEHGAHYTIGALAIILLFSLFYPVPDVLAGGIGIVIIALSVVSSKRANKRDAA